MTIDQVKRHVLYLHEAVGPTEAVLGYKLMMGCSLRRAKIEVGKIVLKDSG